MKQFRDTTYFVTPKGEVFNKGKRIFGFTSNKGYKKIQIWSKNKLQHTMTIHRMVCELYLPNPKNFPQINHIDGDKANNDLTNLEWCEQSYNMQHRLNVLRVGMDQNHKNTKLPFSELQILRWKKDINYPINYDEVSKKWGLRKDYLRKLVNRKYRLKN